jgi:hypothetical protein
VLLTQAAFTAAVAIAFVALSSALPKIIGREVAELSLRYVPWLAAGSAGLAAASLGALACAWRGRSFAAVALLAVGSFACTLCALVGHRQLAPAYSIADQVASLPVMPAQATIFAVDFYDHTLPWYFRRPVTMVSYKDELAEPIKWEPQKFIPDLPGFARAWSAAPAAYAIFSSPSFDSLRKQIGAPMEVVSRGPRYTIVRKP